MEPDHVDRMIESWSRQAPETDVSALEVAGRLLRASAHLQHTIDEALRAQGLSFGDFDVLNTLRRESGREGLNPRELAAAALVTSGAVTSRLDRLERAGLITRSPDPADRRAIKVRLTADGARLAERALEAVLDADARFLAPLSGQQSKAVAAGLKRLLLHHDRGR